MDYARRVRSFSDQWGLYHGVKFFNILREHYPGPGPILPNLQHLELTNTTLSPYKEMFVHPTLSSLAILPNTYQSFPWNELSGTLPTLVMLTTFCAETIALPTHIFDQLSQLSHLRILSLRFISKDYENYTSHCHGRFLALEQLKVWCCANVPTQNPLIASPSISVDGVSSKFPSLALSNLIGSISAPRLAKLSVYVYNSTSWNSLCPVLCKFQRLEELSLQFQSPFFESDIASHGDVNVASLCSLRSIRSFFVSGLPIRLNSPHWNAMAFAWQMIQSLKIESSHGLPRIPIDDLVIFAWHCPRLENLTIEIEPVEADWIWETGDFEELEVPPSPITNLNLQDSIFHPDAAAQVAVFLAHAFPSATIYHGSGTKAGSVFKKILEFRSYLVPPSEKDNEGRPPRSTDTPPSRMTRTSKRHKRDEIMRQIAELEAGTMTSAPM